MVAAIIVAIVFISIVTIVKMFLDHSLRRKLIEKGMVDEKVKYLYASAFENQVPSSLKWGMVLTAIGIALFIGQFVPYSFREEAMISGMFIMAGLALIVYYFMASRMAKKLEKQKGLE